MPRSHWVFTTMTMCPLITMSLVTICNTHFMIQGVLFRLIYRSRLVIAPTCVPLARNGKARFLS